MAKDETSDESAYLLRSPENARRLLDAIERLEHGEGSTHELKDGATESA